MAAVLKVRMTLSLPLIFLLMISGDLVFLANQKCSQPVNHFACSRLLTSGFFGQDWNVIYETESICAPKGSTVNMSCTYRYPQQLKLNDTYWITRGDPDIKSLKAYPEYKDRVEYIEDRQNKTAVLKLHKVTERDERGYIFRLITERENERWIGVPGILLHVSALQVKAPQLVMEKKTFNLSCETTCSLTDGFIWYKNGQALNLHNQTLQLQSERSDSGRYSCAVRGHEHLPSPAVSITVMYPPENTTVSVSPSGEIVEGDSVTLICSSDSNPPALNFSWFKEIQTSTVGSGQSFSISSFNSSHSGRYYCEAQNEYGSERSASVSVTVKERSSSLIRVTVGITAAVVLTSVILMVFIGLLIRRKRVTPSEEQNPRGSQPNKTLESPGDTYMTLEPKSRCSEYDTLDNMKRSG
ncbi:low affinity immunoglobulin gamma Fc region receptor II-c-like [Garra rufa]|uniref:low affinity immunoglobulin gamma Fc region receptor II-c-like n=1 Tax=Garra rufa TaxID=137080 RepID=UPI003CCEF39F